MTREQALITAKANYASHQAASMAHTFKNGPAFNAETEFGYRHGWYLVDGHSFNIEDITGEKYDPDQGGWAWL